jgi:hypothetical protein
LEVETGVQHIIADIMAKDMQIIELIRQRYLIGAIAVKE